MHTEFPGSKPVSEAAAKYGPAYVSGPITFMFEKEEAEKVEENPAPPPLPATDTPAPTEPAPVPAPAQEPAKD